MTQKEIIKNALREKLKELSKEELINIIADISAGFVLARMNVLSAMNMMSADPSSCEVRTDLSEAINAVATNIANRKYMNQQVCSVDGWLFKE